MYVSGMSDYGAIHCLKSFNLILQITDYPLFCLNCFFQLSFLLLNEVPIRLDVLKPFLYQLELLLLIGCSLFFDLVLLLILLKQLDLFVSLDQFNFQLLQQLLVLQLNFVDIGLIFLAEFLGDILDCLLVFCS